MTLLRYKRRFEKEYCSDSLWLEFCLPFARDIVALEPKRKYTTLATKNMYVCIYFVPNKGDIKFTNMRRTGGDYVASKTQDIRNALSGLHHVTV